MTDEKAIVVEHVSKIYKIYDHSIHRLKEAVHPMGRKYHREFYALNDLSFEINRGESVGIVGVNGSGKSTLLKLITGVLTPTTGKLKIHGKVAAILELGAGFNPEYTGIENIYLNGTLMGYTTREIDNKLDAILKFADIGEFVYQSVKMYSSGMFARLAFAVAINVDPDILIIDEALSVGDTKFQIKCIEQMKKIRENGTTILFVSHSIEQIKRFCTKGIWIDKGSIKSIGNANDIVNAYEDSLHLESQEQAVINLEEANLTALQNVEISPSIDQNRVGYIISVACDQRELTTFEDLSVSVTYRITAESVTNFLLGIALYDRDRKYIFGPNTYLDKVEGIPNIRGEHTIIYKIPRIPLLSGTYFVDAGIFSEKGLVYIDYKTSADTFTMKNEYFTEGLVHLEHEWSVVRG